jgi:hypothetical protein
LTDSLLFAYGMAAEAALILVLIRTRAYRTLPAFLFYLCWSLLSDALVFKLQSLPKVTYYRVYEVQMLIDATLMFAVLVELAWSVLRPLRASLPRHAWIGIAGFILLAEIILWPLAGYMLPTHVAPEAEFFVHLQQVPAILRVVIFFAMAGFSQVIGIGWRNRELQVATGLGFYSILSLAIAVLHTHQPGVGNTPQYHWLDEMGTAGYVSALTYWVVAFATKEAERQKFSPQMANFLLLIGGTAKAGRVALADFAVTKTRFKDH